MLYHGGIIGNLKGSSVAKANFLRARVILVRVTLPKNDSRSSRAKNLFPRWWRSAPTWPVVRLRWKKIWLGFQRQCTWRQISLPRFLDFLRGDIGQFCLAKVQTNIRSSCCFWVVSDLVHKLENLHSDAYVNAGEILYRLAGVKMQR